MNYADQQLQLALAKMLPEEIDQIATWQDDSKSYQPEFFWIKRLQRVLDAEWLHVCWLIEENIHWGDYIDALDEVTKQIGQCRGCEQERRLTNASWQQRAIALAKVKGVEIV